MFHDWPRAARPSNTCPAPDHPSTSEALTHTDGMTRFGSGWYSALAALLACALAIALTSPVAATAAPPGDIWKWALGRDLWTDPDLEQYLHPIAQCAAGEQCAGWAQSLDDGWKANPGADGLVVSVELFNDETALGTPNHPNIAGSSSAGLKQAYKGRLPLEKTWRTTANDMAAAYGAGNMVFGRNEYMGIPATFEYLSEDARYKFWFEFYAMTAQDLPNALIHKIEVFRGPKY
jgi:hypothetical protein